MSQQVPTPFSRFTFTLIEDRKPRRAFKMSARDDGMYDVHVEKGSAANPSMQFTRIVPVEIAERLRDGLQAAGVFGWEESYGDTRAPGSMRWSVSTVFKEGVFSTASQGGSDVPAGFDDLLEELYRLDFPRPASSRKEGARMPDAGAEMGADRFSELMSGAGLDGLDAVEIQKLLTEAQANPLALQRRMREEFSHLSADEQERMLDALASSGMASRAWWERFLRG